MLQIIKLVSGTYAILKAASVTNPAAKGVPFTMRCQVTSTAVNFYLDGTLKVTTPS